MVYNVRTYKRESEEQKRSLSTILNSASNGHPLPYYEVEVRNKPKLDNENSGNEYHVMTQQSQQTVTISNTTNTTGSGSPTVLLDSCT